MNSLADLRPGDIGFGPLHMRAARKLVDGGQWMLGEGFEIGRLHIEHVFVVTLARERTEDPETGTGRLYGPECVEAMPNGARRALINTRWNREYAYVRLPEDYPGQAQDSAAIARAMIGTPYSFASYAALALWRVQNLLTRKAAGTPTPLGADRPGLANRLEKWIDRRKPPQDIPGTEEFGSALKVALPAEAICSVLADQAWSLTGKKIMQGVAHQCVTPGALAATLLRMEGAQWLWPGQE